MPRYDLGECITPHTTGERILDGIGGFARAAVHGYQVGREITAGALDFLQQRFEDTGTIQATHAESTLAIEAAPVPQPDVDGTVTYVDFGQPTEAPAPLPHAEGF